MSRCRASLLWHRQQASGGHLQASLVLLHQTLAPMLLIEVGDLLPGSLLRLACGQCGTD